MSLSHIPKLEALSPAVFRVLGCNPGPFCLQGTNSYLLGTGPRKILLDTSEPGIPEYRANLQAALRTFSPAAAIVDVICTHWHQDHVGAVSDVLPLAEEGTHVWKFPGGPAKKVTAEYSPITDGQVFATDGVTLRAVHTPGHTEDHVVLYFEEEGAVFSGDAVLGEGTTVFEDLFTYMKSLDTILELKPERIYPGHGPVVEDGAGKVRAYIAHRNAREAQILDALAAGPASPAGVVQIVYVGLSPSLAPAAEHNVCHHLAKLKKEGRVKEADGRYTIIQSSRV